MEEMNQRIIFDKGWSGFGNTSDPLDNVYLLENFPHDWLFLQCAACGTPWWSWDDSSWTERSMSNDCGSFLWRSIILGGKSSRTGSGSSSILNLPIFSREAGGSNKLYAGSQGNSAGY